MNLLWRPLDQISVTFQGYGATIYNTDWMEVAEALPHPVDFIFADPPYDMKQSEIGKMANYFLKLCPNANWIVFGDPKNRLLPSDWISDIHHWIKSPSTKNTSRRPSRFVEEILVHRPPSLQPYNSDLHQSNYAGHYFDLVEGVLYHEHQKPLSLVKRLMNMYAGPKPLIFDPFSGSGTAAVAALQLGFRYIGCEMDEKRIPTINYRIRKEFTEIIQ